MLGGVSSLAVLKFWLKEWN